MQDYDPRANKVPADLRPGPFQGILAARIDPLLQEPIQITKQEFRDLVEFVPDGLFDERVRDSACTSPNRSQAACRFSASRDAKGATNNRQRAE